MDVVRLFTHSAVKTWRYGLGGFKLQTVVCLAELAGFFYFPVSVFVSQHSKFVYSSQSKAVGLSLHGNMNEREIVLSQYKLSHMSSFLGNFFPIRKCAISWLTLCGAPPMRQGLPITPESLQMVCACVLQRAR